MEEYKIGQVFYAEDDIILNEGKRTETLIVTNMGDRPIQVGSIFIFLK